MDDVFLAERFEAHRTHLRAVAYRLLGSSSEAEDAVQDAWLRLSRSDADDIENLGGWLTTVVARVCLNMLQSRKSRREDPLPDHESAPLRGVRTGHAGPADPADPEHEAILADSVGIALLVVLDTLTPAERLAFVLHDMFALPFEEIAPVVDRTPAAARQLASRARRRVQGQEPTAVAGPDPVRQRQVVAAFLAASRGGDFEALLAILDPDVVVRADGAAVLIGATREVRGAADVAGTFAGRAQAARPALVDGVPGLAWAPAGRPRVVFRFTIRDGRIAAIDLVADADQLSRLDLELLDG